MIRETECLMDHSNSHHIHRQKRGNSAATRIVIVAISYLRAHHKEPHINNITGRRLTVVAPNID